MFYFRSTTTKHKKETVNRDPKHLLQKRAEKLTKLNRYECPFDTTNYGAMPPPRKCQPIKYDRDITKNLVGNPFTLPSQYRTFSKPMKLRRKYTPETYMGQVITIRDLDDHFYSAIEGRPIGAFQDFKAYMNDIRMNMVFKSNAAYLKDIAIRMKRLIDEEQEIYDEIFQLYTKTRSNFVMFASESYEKARHLQAQEIVVHNELQKRIDDLEEVHYNYGNVSYSMEKLIGRFETQCKFKKFLTYLAPIWWKEQIAMKSEKNLRSMSNILKDVYESGDSISKYNHCVKQLQEIEPILYFHKPEHLMMKFGDMEKMCLNYLQINYADILLKIGQSKKSFQRRETFEVGEIKFFIDILEKEVALVEEKEASYEAQFYHLLMNKFQELYASYDNTKLLTCVQYTHQRIFGEYVDPKDSIKTLTGDLEKLYITLSMQLDDLDQIVVKQAIKELFTQDKKMMEQAKLAQRQLKEWNILTKSLYASFLPPLPTKPWHLELKRKRREQLEAEKENKEGGDPNGANVPTVATLPALTS